MIMTLTGPSASGKTVLARALTERGFSRPVTTTTRPPREGEVDGLHYHFVDRDRFETLAMVETNCHNGHWYGLSQDALDTAIAAGPVVIVMDPNGAQAMKAYGARAQIPVRSVFVHAPLAVCLMRLWRRSEPFAARASRTHSLLRVERRWRSALPWDRLIQSHQASPGHLAGQLA